MSLNENQRRGVTSTLRLLEEQIAEIERMIEHDERGILYHRSVNYPAQKRQEMRSMIEKMRDEIRCAAEQFDLPIQIRNTPREIAGSLALTWESLEEIRSHRLNGYGTVDSSLEKTLDPIIERLVRLTLELEDKALGKRRQ